MKVISIEDHYTTQAMRDANANHPLVDVSVLREFAKQPSGGGFQGVSEQLIERLFDLGELRLESMDAAGIDLQVVSHTVPDAAGLASDVAVRLAREANDFLAASIAAHPDRLRGFATLPMGDPTTAADELRRAVNELGFVGALINGHVNGRYLDDEFFWPVFEAAEALDVPIYLHPNVAQQAVADACYAGVSPVIHIGLISGMWGWHIDTGLHTLRLIINGVFDRFPRLQLIIGHLGETLPSMLWRIGWSLDRISGLNRPIEEYFQENISVTTSGVFHHAPFAAAVQALGIDRILFSVDYPYSPNDEGRAFLDSLPVSPADREKIAHGNAERLLKLS